MTEVKKKRHRRTKAEMAVVRGAEVKKIVVMPVLPVETLEDINNQIVASIKKDEDFDKLPRPKKVTPKVIRSIEEEMASIWEELKLLREYVRRIEDSKARVEKFEVVTSILKKTKRKL